MHFVRVRPYAEWMVPGTGRPQGLAGDILIAGRHPRITENSAHTVPQTTVLWTGTPVLYRLAHFRP